MLDVLFDLPLLISGPATVGPLCLYAVVGLLIVRRQLSPRLWIRVTDAEFSSAMLQGLMVFRGLSVALIAVNVWQTCSDGSMLTSQEATPTAALYRDVGCCPDPIRPQLQQHPRESLDQVIHEA